MFFPGPVSSPGHNKVDQGQQNPFVKWMDTREIIEVVFHHAQGTSDTARRRAKTAGQCVVIEVPIPAPVSALFCGL